ncbi:methyltransferase domain-containing protein [Candidatus Margulisiibacteriota bacterium]
MNPVTKIGIFISNRSRGKRAGIFRELFIINPKTKILDLGSINGTNINAVLKGTRANPKNIYIADIDTKVIAEGQRLFGYTPVAIKESEPLPYPNGYFDIVFCSSVIEHVTVPKGSSWKTVSQKEFTSISQKNQKKFASEIRRLGKQYFVQTPYKYFPIESHTWLPFIAWLPRPALIMVLRFTNLFWPKKSSPEWYLLDKKEMQDLFPEAEIIFEKVLGFTKSIMAVYRNPQ